MKVGYVSIVGKPNVGKSSLLNDIFSRKVSIVTKKAQTTRNAISNIYNDEDSQIIFGVAFDPTLEDEMRITIIAAGFNSDDKPESKADTKATAKPANDDFFAGLF